jgi:hypothetical protein
MSPICATLDYTAVVHWLELLVVFCFVSWGKWTRLQVLVEMCGCYILGRREAKLVSNRTPNTAPFLIEQFC